MLKKMVVLMLVFTYTCRLFDFINVIPSMMINIAKRFKSGFSHKKVLNAGQEKKRSSQGYSNFVDAIGPFYRIYTERQCVCYKPVFLNRLLHN